MNIFTNVLYDYALSIFLIVLLVVAIRFVYKRRKKYEKNEFE